MKLEIAGWLGLVLIAIGLYYIYWPLTIILAGVVSIAYSIALHLKEVNGGSSCCNSRR